MANLSNTYGTIIFEAEFFNQHDRLIEDAFDQVNQDFSEDYGFNKFCYPAYNPQTGNQEYSFKGTGRWSFFSIQKNLFNYDWYSNVDKNSAWMRFLKTLHDEQTTVILEYTDSESANDVLYKATAEYKEGKLIRTERDDYDYNLYNVHTLVDQISPNKCIWSILDASTLSEALSQACESDSSFKRYWNAFNDMDENTQNDVVEDIQNDPYLNGYIATEDETVFDVLDELMI